MSMLVAIKDWDATPWVDEFRARLPGRRIVLPGDGHDPSGVHYAATWKHSPGSLLHYPGLRAIFSLGAGVDHVFADKNLPDVPVVRVVDADLTMRMSEWVLLHVLMHHRQQRMYDWQQGERIWEDDRFQPAASAVRVGVMGLGVLGGDAARKLKMTGFDVAGWSRQQKTIEGIECFAGDGRDAFLARTDILVCLLPLTPETRGILDAGLLARLARDGRLGGPILLNAGRGGLQVEADILAALNEGVLKAATLDVFEREPLPQDSPLWTHPAVTISPHNAAASEPEAIVAAIVRQIAALERGGVLTGVVDQGAGY